VRTLFIRGGSKKQIHNSRLAPATEEFSLSRSAPTPPAHQERDHGLSKPLAVMQEKHFRRTLQYAQFFRRNAKWDPSKANYGFEGEESDVLADDLECLLDTIASFMPGPYITHQITKMTINMQSVWDVIWNHYGVKPTQLTSLDFMSLKMESDDRYIDL